MKKCTYIFIFRLTIPNKFDLWINFYLSDFIDLLSLHATNNHTIIIIVIIYIVWKFGIAEGRLQPTSFNRIMSNYSYLSHFIRSNGISCLIHNLEFYIFSASSSLCCSVLCIVRNNNNT